MAFKGGEDELFPSEVVFLERVVIVAFTERTDACCASGLERGIGYAAGCAEVLVSAVSETEDEVIEVGERRERGAEVVEEGGGVVRWFAFAVGG